MGLIRTVVMPKVTSHFACTRGSAHARRVQNASCRPSMLLLLRFFMMLVTIGHIQGLFKSSGLVRGSLRSLSMAKDGGKETHQLVLLRHGESTWNDKNLFTGWYDCPLSEKGKLEAEAAGKLLQKNGFKFDLAYSSYLQRAIRTLWFALEETNQMHIPIKTAWELNERHYGALQGMDKQQTVDKFGKEQVKIWRRSYDVPPPPIDLASPMYPGNDPKYASIPKAADVRTESLKITLDRVLPFWHENIAPEIKQGKRVIIAAHGNSLRALVKYLDNIPEDVIAGLNIPTGVPLVYELDADLKPIPHPDAIAPLTGRYVGDQDDIRRRIEGVVNQTK